MDDEIYMEYEELEIFLREELNKLVKGELKPFCQKHDLVYHEISRFRQGKLPTTRPFFFKEILEAFGYKTVKVMHKIFFHATKLEKTI